jgi:hypothetical protein
MIFTIIGLIISLWLLWLSYETLKKAPAKISKPVAAYDNQYEVMRDMEPNSQIRENPWVGFLQEDVHAGRTGDIGEFVGVESRSGRAALYDLQGGDVNQNQAPPALNAAQIDASAAEAAAKGATQRNINAQNST